MWEQDPALFLQDNALLPLAPLAAAANPEPLLAQTAQQVSRIESMQQQREVSAYTQLLAGLRFKKTIIRQLFRERAMRESVIYIVALRQQRLTCETVERCRS
ncbi:hypothetical protein BST81_25760 [Leptolyngbya sp. 'hensonii']|nr:hypothetical protein BST81_25760 [Leptolyngbya sp. 'hensonii']